MLIYHFTTFDALCKIINLKLLKFGKLQHSNDPCEHLYPKSLIDNFVKQLHPKDYQNLLSHFHMNISNNDDLYLSGICFSKKLNNVHNWMEYGDHGYGVALGFDYNKLKEVFKENNLNVYIDLDDVIYSKSNALQRVNEIINTSNDFIETSCRLGKLYKYIKQPSYFVEYECRISHLPSIETDMFNISDISSELLFFKDRNLNCYVLNLELLYNRGIFKKIIFGSNVEKNNIKKLEKYINSQFPKVRFAFSQVFVEKKEKNFDE